MSQARTGSRAAGTRALRSAASVTALAASLFAACGQGARDLAPARGSDAGRQLAASGKDSGRPVPDAGAGAGQRRDAYRPITFDPLAPPPLAIDVMFSEVGLEAGLASVQAPVATTAGCEELPPGRCGFSSLHMSGGAAAGDYDGDGWVDLYVTRLLEPGILYRNAGGRFEDATEAAGLDVDRGGNGAAFGDIDNDGDLDLYVTNVFAQRYALYVNERGRFSEQGSARGADVSSQARHHGFSPTFGDYDADGFLDLHLTEWVQLALADPAPSHARLLRNRGASAAGRFEDVTEAAGVDLLRGPRGTRTSYSSRFADMDGDGALDLLVVADFGTSRLFWNEGPDGFVDGTLFSGVGGDQNGMGAALGDYDGDGDLDWFISAIFDPDYRCDDVSCGWGTSGNRLYRNDGSRRFADVTDVAGVRDGGWGWGAEFFDLDNDGALDLVMANGVDFPNPEAERFRSDPTRLWRNLGGGRFEDAAERCGIADRGDGKGLLVLDYDRDGDQDVLIAQHEARVLLYRNDGGDRNAWLTVELQGRAANRQGIGARVLLTRAAGERPLLREVSGGNGFLGQSEAVAHFGLGNWSRPVHELRVQWPGGREQVLRGVAVRQRLVVREPR